MSCKNGNIARKSRLEIKILRRPPHAARRELSNGVLRFKHDFSDSSRECPLHFVLVNHDNFAQPHSTQTTHQARVSPKQGKTDEILFSVEHEPGV